MTVEAEAGFPPPVLAAQRKRKSKHMIPLKDTIRHRGFPAVTLVIIVLNAVVFLYEISIPKDLLLRFFYLFGLVPARYSYPRWAIIHGLSFDDYLSFVTAMFIHGGWLHIIGNMWFLYLFGSSVEDRLGHLRFSLFYFLAGVTASVVYYLLDIHSRIPEFGASGAIAGVMGAYVLLFPKAKILTFILILFIPLLVEFSAFIYLGYWFLLQFVSGALTFRSSPAGGGVAWWAHVGGFLAGIAFLPIFRRKQRKDYPDEFYRG
jgi:membrane associated rhomboid family serine protease